MTKPTTTRLTVSGLIGTAAAISLLLPGALTGSAANASGPPAEYDLNGIIRDFREAHSDFAVMPAEGLGHSAMNVNAWLAGDARPRHVGGGFLVDTQWTDASSRNIAPGLYGTTPGAGQGSTLGIRVTDKVELKSGCQIDSFSSTRGLYNDNGNYGSQAYVSTDSTEDNKIKVDKNAVIYGDVFCGPGSVPDDVFDISGFVSGSQSILSEAEGTPQIVLPDPADIESNAGDLTIDGTTVSWEGWIPSSEDDWDDTKALWYDDIEIKDDAVVNVTGDLRIICRTLKVQKRSVINLAPESNLTFFVVDTTKDVEIRDDVRINVAPNSAAGVDSGIFTLNYLGDRKVRVEKSHAYMVVVAPIGKLEIKDAAHVYGSYLGKELKLDKDSGFHVDLSNGDDGHYNPAILVRDKIEFDDVTVDHFDSNLGPYDGPSDGGTNYGESALIQTNSIKNDKIKLKGNSNVAADVVVGVGGNPSDVVDIDGGSTLSGTTNALTTPLPIPAVTPPAMSVPYMNDVEYKDTTVTLSTDLHCKKLKIDKARVLIDGDITIRCDDKLEMKDRAEIQLLPGATLTIFIKKEMKVDEKSLINTSTGNPQLVSIRRMSLGKKGKVEIKKESEVYAWIQGAKTELKLEDKAKLFGNFMGEKARIKGDSELHVDMAGLITCIDIDDVPGTSGAGAVGGVTSSVSFGEWFREVAGVNQSAVQTITMVRNGSGIYEYLDDDFRPIDGQLLGNEGDTNNHHFTYAIAADFVYNDCGGQFIKFGGGDGAWMFVDGRLVMDLGGMKTSEKQFVEMDRLGLKGGESYRINFFFASRRPDSKEFKLQTNIELSTARTIPIVSAAYD